MTRRGRSEARPTEQAGRKMAAARGTRLGGPKSSRDRIEHPHRAVPPDRDERAIVGTEPHARDPRMRKGVRDSWRTKRCQGGRKGVRADEKVSGTKRCQRDEKVSGTVRTKRCQRD